MPRKVMMRYSTPCPLTSSRTTQLTPKFCLPSPIQMTLKSQSSPSAHGCLVLPGLSLSPVWTSSSSGIPLSLALYLNCCRSPLVGAWPSSCPTSRSLVFRSTLDPSQSRNDIIAVQRTNKDQWLIVISTHSRLEESLIASSSYPLHDLAHQSR